MLDLKKLRTTLDITDTEMTKFFGGDYLEVWDIENGDCTEEQRLKYAEGVNTLIKERQCVSS